MKIYLFVLLVFAQFVAFSQASSVYFGAKKMEKEELEGLYVETTVDKKTVEKAWEAKLTEFGKLGRKGDLFFVPMAVIPAISGDLIAIESKITTVKNETILFCAFDMGNGKYLSPAEAKPYAAGEKFLRDFLVYLRAFEEQTSAEKDYAEAMKKHQKIQKNKERLEAELSRNVKEKETFLKKMEENKLENLKIQQELQINKTEANSFSNEVENKRVILEKIRGRFSTPK
jgi:predicted ribosome quality control (RQC) complex YloA/Tae2 family protein